MVNFPSGPTRLPGAIADRLFVQAPWDQIRIDA